MEFDFTGKYGKAVDTVIIAGENGCGKSTLLNELYKVVAGQSPETNITEYEIDGEVYSVVKCTPCQGHSVFYFPQIWTLSFCRIPGFVQ